MLLDAYVNQSPELLEASSCQPDASKWAAARGQQILLGIWEGRPRVSGAAQPW